MDTPLLGFSHLQLRVRNVEASREWYSTVLGIEPLTTADDGSYVALQHKPSHMVIVISSRVDSPDGAAAEVGDDIVTATVTSPQGFVVGFIRNPHFGAD
jgi:catechol 2,3-dioxygenase-like lactoylglutathione lyase family enzyme